MAKFIIGILEKNANQEFANLLSQKQESVGWVFTQQNDSLQIDSSGAVVLDFRVVDFLDFTLRLCLSRSVENLLLTSSLALLDSTLPKIRQNDGKGVVILRSERPKNLFVSKQYYRVGFTSTKKILRYAQYDVSDIIQCK